MTDQPEINIIAGYDFLSRMYWGLRKNLPFIKELIKELKRDYYDVIHLTSSASYGLLRDWCALFVARRYSVRTVIHFHFGRIPNLINDNNWEYRLLKKVICMADLVIVIDNQSYYSLINEGFRNIKFLPNPLAPSITDIISHSPIKTRAVNYILFAGHVVPEKGIFELVDACRHITNIKLCLMGPYLEEVKEQLYQVAGDGAESWLEIPGSQSLDKVINEMLRCSLFVLPSYSEGFPNVIIESMACGCAIITTPVGAIPEMLDFQSNTPCGVCIPVKDKEALRSEIEYYLENQQEAFILGNRARNRVEEKYSMHRVWTEISSLWEECFLYTKQMKKSS